MSSRRWWREEHDGRLAQSVQETLRRAMDRDQRRVSVYQALTLLYDEHGMHGIFSPAGKVLREAEDYRLPRNVMRRLVNTAYTRLIASVPRPFFCSDGGDFELRQRLERLNTAVAGLFLATDADRHARLAQKHACLYGVGFLKVAALTHLKKPRVSVERVYPWEVFVDALDAAYGAPRAHYQAKWYDRPHLLELWPNKKAAIERAGSGTVPAWSLLGDHLGDPIRVVEAWYIDPYEGDGRHVIALDDATLLDEEYPHDAPPLVPFWWSDPTAGYWPTGLGFELSGQQIEVNEISDAISETIKRCAWPTIFIEKNSKVQESTLDNTIGKLVEYTGAAPTTVTPTGLTSESRAHLADVIASMYESSGISQYAAQAQKPAGLESGRALRIYADQQDGNLRDPSELRAESYVALGMALIRAQRAVSEVDPTSRVVFSDPRQKTVQSILWREVDLPDDGLRLVKSAVSMLPTTPGAKAAALDEMTNAGLLTPEEARDEMDLPDIKALNGPAVAPRRIILRQLQEIARDGIAHLPEPFFPLALAKQLTAQHYCQAMLDEVPEERLELLRQYLQACLDLEAQAQPEPTPTDLPPDLPPEEAGAPLPPEPTPGAMP